MVLSLREHFWLRKFSHTESVSFHSFYTRKKPHSLKSCICSLITYWPIHRAVYKHTIQYNEPPRERTVYSIEVEGQLKYRNKHRRDMKGYTK